MTSQDRLVYGGIVGAALICLALLAWGHLGVSALLFPPRTTPAQVAHTSGITVVLRVETPYLTVSGPNELTFTLRDAATRPLEGAAALVQLRMISMDMEAPSVQATASGDGVYVAHPRFAMAGIWRLVITVTPPGGASQQTAFVEGVRWN